MKLVVDDRPVELDPGTTALKLADSAVNFLTNSGHDPSSKIPEYKVCAVRIEAASNTVRPSG